MATIVHPLSPSSRPAILAHLLALVCEDRRLRFGVRDDGALVSS